MKPRDANSESELMKLKTDNFATRDYWILHNGESITIANQKNGESCKAIIRITRKQFNRIVDWYNKNQ